MLDTVWNDDEFARTNQLFPLNTVLADLHPQLTLDDEEQLIFNLVMMPHEVALQLRQLHEAIVDFADNLWAVAFCEQRELLRQIHFFQATPPRFIRLLRGLDGAPSVVSFLE